MTDSTRGVNDPASRAAAAISYAQRGWRVIQLHAVNIEGSCTCERGGLCTSTGKHPINGGWQNTPALSPQQVAAEWTARPWANLGVATGAPSGFWVLDIDPDHGGMDTMKALVAQHGGLPSTTTQRTGSGGWHYFFALPDFEVRNTQQADKKFGGPGLDVRGNGGQIVIAPSVSGKGPYFLNDGPIAPAPEWLLAMLRPAERAAAQTLAPAAAVVTAPATGAEAARLTSYADSVVNGELAKLAECSAKGWQGPAWNATTYGVACNLTELANSDWAPIDHAGVEALMLERSPRDGGFDDEEILKCLRSARTKIGDSARGVPAKPVDIFGGFTGGGAPRAGEINPRAHHRTWDDLGNAARIVDHYGDQIRYVTKDKAWSVWDGKRWEHYSTEQVLSLIQRLLANLADIESHLYDDVTIVPTDKQSRTRRQMFIDWTSGQRMAARIDAAEKMVKVHPSLQAAPSDFDSHPMLLNVANGVIDLRTGELGVHDSSLLLSQYAPIAYDPNAPAPRWEAFLADVMPDLNMRAYLQRISGYAITGDISEQAMFIHQGSGANGKSQYLVVLGAVLGDYNQIVPKEALLARNGDSVPTGVARMIGKRVLQFSETGVGRRLDEETIKSLTGGESVVARHLFGREFEFTPTGKILYITNHLPHLSDADSMWRRLHLITWDVVIPEDDRVASLGMMLARDEGPGILAWLIRGCLAWQQQGLGRPSTSVDALHQYRRDVDGLGEFLEDFLVPAAGAHASMSAIYTAYLQWAALSGLGNKTLTKQTLSLALRERGYTPYRNGIERGFVGYVMHSPALQMIDFGQ